MADGECFFPNYNLHPGYFGNSHEIDQQIIVAFGKPTGFQLLRNAFHGLIDSELSYIRMIDAVMRPNLHIRNLPGQQANIAGLRFQQNVRPFAGRGELNPRQESGELQLELGVFDRLYYEVRCSHFVALYGVLLHAGHKNEQDGAVLFPEGMGGIHPVEHGHHNIHEDHVVLGRILIQKGNCVGEKMDFNGYLKFCAVLADVLLQQLGGCVFVFNDGNFQHNLHLILVPIIANCKKIVNA